MESNAYDKLVREYKAYLEDLKKASIPLDIDWVQFKNCQEEEGITQEQLYNCIYASIILIPLVNLLMVKLNQFFDEKLVTCLSEIEQAPKAAVGEVYDFLKDRNPDRSKEALLAMNDGNNLYIYYCEGKDAFCNYVLEQKINLGGIAQFVCSVQRFLALKEYLTDTKHEIEDNIIAFQLWNKQFPDSKHAREASEILDKVHSLPSISTFKESIENLKLAFHKMGTDKEEREIINDILNREHEIPDEYLNKRNSLPAKPKISIPDDADYMKVMEEQLKIYEEAIPTLAIVKNKIISEEEVLNILGNPESYLYKDIHCLEHGSTPTPEENDYYFGFGDIVEINSVEYCFFINALANIGYIENSEENLYRTAFIISGRTSKDKKTLVNNKVLLKKTENGQTQSATIRAIYYIVKTITEAKVENSNKPKPKYSKVEVLFEAEKEDQKYLMNKEYHKTKYIQRADNKIKALIELVFCIEPEFEKKGTSSI